MGEITAVKFWKHTKTHTEGKSEMMVCYASFVHIS